MKNFKSRRLTLVRCPNERMAVDGTRDGGSGTSVGSPVGRATGMAPRTPYRAGTIMALTGPNLALTPACSHLRFSQMSINYHINFYLLITQFFASWPLALQWNCGSP